MTVKTVLRTIAASGFEESIKAFDVNADGYLCIKIIPNEGGPPQFDPAFLYLDNKIWDLPSRALYRSPAIGSQTQLDLVRVDRVDVKVDGHLRGAGVAEPVEQWRAGGP
jgi:hypothetical protein